MNRDAMLVALGVGVGALICTEQGRTIIGSLTKTPIAQAIGETAMNFLNSTAGNTGSGNSSSEEQGEEGRQQLPQHTEATATAAQQGA